MTESQRSQWVLSTPVCAEVHNSMHEVSGVKTETGPQNKDFDPSRVARDWKDTNLVQEYLEERNPFDYGQELCNVSDISVNVDSSVAIGENIISKIVGATAAVTMASKSAVKVGGEVGQVDPQLLFQSLTIAGKSNCTFPPTLFESKGLLHEPQKATFADALWTAIQNILLLLLSQHMQIM